MKKHQDQKGAMTMTTKVYYSLAEIVNQEDYFIINYHDPYDPEGVLKLDWGVEETVSNIMTAAGDMFESSDNISKQLMAHIWANISHKNVLCLEVKHPRWVYVNKDNITDFISNDEAQYEARLLGQSIWSIYIDTQERYRALIGIYNNELNDLMKQVETDSETRFNDTPQNLPVSDGYAADNYTTTITSSKVKSDGTSVINRIDEVQQKLRDVYADWAFQFNKLVMED